MSDAAPSNEDRRIWPRRRKQLRVLVADPGDALDDPYLAWILDRSPGGLCLSVGSMDIEEGTILGVRPTSAAAHAPFIEVLVKNRRERDHCLELGCEFVRSLNWETLIQFG